MTLALFESDRVVITGATGWFGRTARLLMPPEVKTLPLASRARDGCREFSLEDIRKFKPTMVLNFAFLTREKASILGAETFRAANIDLLEKFRCIASLPSVRGIVTVSSGAAIMEPDHPYGELKLREEELALSYAADRAVSILRAYSVSGGLVRQPRSYAFSDLILQSQTGSILVRSDHPTFRRYVSVSDALCLAVLDVNAGHSGIIETGGALIEMAELADKVRTVVNPAAHVSRVPLTGLEGSVYASDGVSWDEACDRNGYEWLPLEQQIAAVAESLQTRASQGEEFG